MASILRLAAFTAILGQFACSNTSPEQRQSLPPFAGTIPAASGTGGPSQADPGLGDTPTPSEDTDTPSDNAGSEAPSDLPLSPSDPAPVVTAPTPDPSPEPTANPPADDPTVQPPEEAPPVLSTDRSSMPVRGNGGQPPPAGAAGNLRVLDWAGFQAAVSYTFDDTNQTQIDNYAALQALGVRMSFYLITGPAKTAQFNNAIWQQMIADGHEVANHTQSHLQTGNLAALAADTDVADTALESKFDVPVFTMAAPYGNTTYGQAAQTRYLINRGTGDAQIAPNGNTDPFNLSCFIPAPNAPLSAFNNKIDAIRTNGTWQVMLVHGFLRPDGSADPADFQPVSIGTFVQGVNYAKSFGDVWIDSLVNVGAYWRGQKAFTSVTPTAANGVTTWTWTLPDHFPPGRFLRVTVSGGTLSQDGAQLVWDDHGFYEVALDRGSLTLSP